MKKLIVLVFCLGSALFFHSCSKSPDPKPAVPPVAKAGTDITVTIGSDVFLDGSSSTGPAGITYEWSYIATTIPETAINFRNKTSAIATFTPPASGEFNFKLTVTSGTATSEDDLKVTVMERAQIIGGTLANGFKFSNIEPDPTKPDYKITSSLVISSLGIQQSLDGIVLEFAEGTGIEFKGPGILTGGKFTSPTNWKGILVSNGNTLSLTNTTIVNAGVGLFTGQTESAAVTNGIGTITLINSTFVGTTGYDVLSPYKVTLAGNTFSSTKPIKLNGQYLPNVSGNTLPPNYDYITVTANEPDKTLNVSGRIVFGALKYFIANDLNIINTNIIVAAGATLLVAEGAGIFTRDSVVMKGTAANPITIKGLNGAHWKGLALFSQVPSDIIDIDHLVMTDAGSANFNNTTFFTSDVAAAIHVGARVSIKNSQITSTGYGISFATDDNVFNYNAPATVVTGNTFHSTLSSARVDYSRVGDYLPGGHNNIFDPAASAAAVELIAYKNPVVGETQKVWFPLGPGQFYLVNTDIIFDHFALTLQPGVVLKFKAGKSMYTPIPPPSGAITPGLFLTAIGTANQHIVFDGEAGTPGSWGGLSLNEKFDLEYCEIKNGGGLITPGATEKANLTIRPFVDGAVFYFSNNLTTGSAGYGVVLETGAPSKAVDFPPDNNVYTNNVSGNVKTK